MKNFTFFRVWNIEIKTENCILISYLYTSQVVAIQSLSAVTLIQRA